MIRNPFDKLVSGFHFFERAAQSCSAGERMRKFGKKLLNRSDPIDCVTGNTCPERFRSWIRNGGWIDDRDKYMIDGVVCIDYFIQYEDLQSGIRQVCEFLDIPYRRF